MTLKPYVRALFLTPLLVAAASSYPSAAQIRPGVIPCPKPDAQTLNVSQMNATSPDFAPLPPNTRLGSGLNDTTANQFFRHSFSWRSPGKCCQILSAVLTIRIMSNGPVGARTGSSAGNDTWSVVGNGVTIAGNGEGYVYPTTGGPNTVRTITVNLNAQALAHMNNNNRLSFQVQDDSRVTAASLRINRCCLTI